MCIVLGLIRNLLNLFISLVSFCYFLNLKKVSATEFVDEKDSVYPCAGILNQVNSKSSTISRSEEIIFFFLSPFQNLLTWMWYMY